MSNITVTVEKENEFGKMNFDTVRLTEVGGADSTHSYNSRRCYSCATLQFNYRG